MRNGNSLTGKTVYIKSGCFYAGEWGIIKHFDGEFYHIAIANGCDSVPVFSRNEFIVKRNKK